jgi:hypothetical protein
MELLLALTFGVIGLLFGGLMMVLAVRVPKRYFTAEIDLGWRRGPLFLGGLMFVVGVIGLVAPTFWLKMLSPTDEYPAGWVDGVITTENGQRVVPLTHVGRLQVYDAEWNFLRGWFIGPGGGGAVALRPLKNDNFEVLTARGNYRYVFNTSGELISTGTYPGKDFPLSSGESAVVPTPWWLWVFAGPLYWFLLCAGGSALIALACLGGKRDREKLGEAAGNSSATQRLTLG